MMRLSESGRLRTGLVTLLVLLLVAAPFFLTSSMVFRLGAAVTAALLALSFNLLFHSLGLVSFGHAGFFALGGYSIGVLMQHGWSWPAALLAAVALGATVGVLFGAFALRTSGVFFSILTLALCEIIHIIALQWTDVTGGDNGLYGIAPGTVAGIDLNEPVFYYWILVVLAVLGAAALKLVRDSRFGRTLRAIREDDTRAAYLGIPVHRYRTAAFAVSAATAALAGALYAPLIGLMAPADAGWQRSAEPILATLVGGGAAFLGPVLGAFLFAGIEFVLNDVPSLRSVLTGLILLAVIFVAPGGITGARRKAGGRLTSRNRRQASVSTEEASTKIAAEGDPR